VAMLALLLAGCDDAPGRPNPANRPLLPSQVTDFDTLYKNNCAGCHGRDGNLGPAPPLADPLFLAIVPDAELLRVVTEGRSGTQMPAFAQSHGGTLTAAQVKVIVEGLKGKWGVSGRSAESAPPYLLEHTAAGTLAGNSKEGARVFADACAGCHGADGTGGEAAGSIRDPAFLKTVSNQVLRRYVLTGRHDLGMPDYADPEGRPEGFKPLTPRQVTDLVALLVEWKEEAK
jgi:cytochrome c oxidase cbb3-type subunit III